MKNFKSLVTTKSVGVVAGLAAVVASAALVSVGSTAAFSGSTANEGNNWEAGQIALTNGHADTPLFADADILPGYSKAQCITVTTNAKTVTEIHMFSGDQSEVSDLTDNLQLNVTSGTGSATDCSDFVAGPGPGNVFNGNASDFITNHTNYENGVVPSNFLMAAGGSQTYRIQVTLPNSAPNALQGTMAQLDFAWENRKA